MFFSGPIDEASNNQPNILIDNDGRARLTDFGFTSVVREVDSVFITHVQGFTPRWAAPEVLESGDKNTREADIFAFGMVMIEVGSCACTALDIDDSVTPSRSRCLPESYRSASSRQR